MASIHVRILEVSPLHELFPEEEYEYEYEQETGSYSYSYSYSYP